MHPSRIFCSDASVRAGEPIAGSASTCAELVLVSWPKRAWGADALDSTGLPASLPGWLAARAADGRKVALRLVSRPDTSTDLVTAMGWTAAGSWRVDGVPPAELAERMDAATGVGARPALVVCTHGRHDACCALHGQGLAEQARGEVARRGLDLEVWESTHLGGHRFAATAISLPSGHMHGRLRPADAAALVDHAAGVSQGPILDLYRGSVFQGEAQQVAEAAALAWAAQQSWGGAASVGEPRDGVVPVRVGERALAVRVERRAWSTVKSCSEAPAGAVEVTRLVAAEVSEESPTIGAQEVRS